jgi:hypothetical protein
MALYLVKYRIRLGKIFHMQPPSKMSRGSSLAIATGHGLDDRMSGARFPAGDRNFSLRHHVQTGSGAHPVSNPAGTGGSFPEGKAAWV